MEVPVNLLLITGGRHPYHETTPILQEFLQRAGHTVTLSESAEELAGGLGAYNAIVLNTLRQAMSGNELPTAKQEGLRKYVHDGGGLLSVHISAASCPEWAESKKITGGGWVLGKSWHPPFGWFQVFMGNPSHSIAQGVSDFWTWDECYCGVDIQPGIDIFMHGIVENEKRPLGWSHKYGKGKVANIALGHAGASQQHPSFQRLILNSVDYVTAK
ncbi:MAG: ThuA domain-containing protein [Dehalococcoidia bacterium]|nr:ThuA domain-containing protein [Dehalococcoidia bacterium]MSQ35231.1 ThuA domain-containing protein [Dehalococcoidia bacterium]